MHPSFERNRRFWSLNHVVLSLFRRTYVESLSLHFLKEKECVFASFREIISVFGGSTRFCVFSSGGGFGFLFEKMSKLRGVENAHTWRRMVRLTRRSTIIVFGTRWFVRGDALSRGVGSHAKMILGGFFGFLRVFARFQKARTLRRAHLRPRALHRWKALELSFLTVLGSL